MKILYGIQLNGNGHLTRSLDIIEELSQRKHDIDILTSGQNSNLNLGRNHIHFRGLDLILNGLGSISWWDSFKKANLYRLINDINNFDTSKYDLVISDFEPVSAWSSKKNNTKSLGISNQCSIINEIVHNTKDYIYREFIRKFAPCDDYIPLDYTNPVINKKLLVKDKEIDSILVYLPNLKIEKQLEVFSEFPKYEFIVYSKYQLDSADNIKIKLHDRESFIPDLIRCNSVITASGFTTTTESLVLCKKIWSIPTKGHFEQLSNSKKLKDLGIFTEPMNTQNFKIWIDKFDKVKYNWKNPMKDIIKKIESYES
jgi:uncharacterized protein (TIGR00661 family)